MKHCCVYMESGHLQYCPFAINWNSSYRQNLAACKICSYFVAGESVCQHASMVGHAEQKISYFTCKVSSSYSSRRFHWSAMYNASF